jgi:hypothetical protein
MSVTFAVCGFAEAEDHLPHDNGLKRSVDESWQLVAAVSDRRISYLNFVDRRISATARDPPL